MEKIITTGLIELSVIIYDNSTCRESFDSVHKLIDVEYVHDCRNIGVVPAYQYAVKYCQLNNISWLLRLDQDSLFDKELIEYFLAIDKSNNLLAIVPKILSNNLLVSPSYHHLGGRYTPIEIDKSGIVISGITFINSMSFINVSSNIITSILEKQKFMLDLSDHELALALPNNSIYVMDCFVSHSLSITEDKYIPISRYKLILENEIQMIKQREGVLGSIIYKLRLIIRTLKFVYRGSFKLALLTVKSIIS
ncbi:MAG: hypothetical protein E7099_08500 [Mediterranea massiliensis]|nr:hypothetical protein [Mediterranea massiliensis]